MDWGAEAAARGRVRLAGRRIVRRTFLFADAEDGAEPVSPRLLPGCPDMRAVLPVALGEDRIGEFCPTHGSQESSRRVRRYAEGLHGGSSKGSLPLRMLHRPRWGSSSSIFAEDEGAAGMIDVHKRR
ncbi:hypothetical protein BD626DRAFT_478179 [Schizophyllum amplum]|uniref:Uncharacterized protein n=1 Tax=Schizophyllum amplum TaxID=97359 RepID=A0A550D0U9_9AGAR|nr:hypothetical protein BD626DRAFT_478179 [Auriculariopsis ampla]